MYALRQCKKPAHVLAALRAGSLGAGLAEGDHQEWFTSYPDDIISDVTGDFAVSK